MTSDKHVMDKTYFPAMDDGLGSISIRVVVFPKAQPQSGKVADQPLDMEADEDFSEETSQVNSYMESPTKGKLCCVFLINGQRHHGLDNTLIVNELGFKYLRKRMIVVVTLDGLSSRAVAEIIQGSRVGLYEGDVYHAIVNRMVKTLKDDPELEELEQEAEEELSQLQAGDEAVQHALDQLIETHFDFGDHSAVGAQTAGGHSAGAPASAGTSQATDVVSLAEKGEPATEPVLYSEAPETIRFRPEDGQRAIRVEILPAGTVPKDLNAHLVPAMNDLTLEVAKAPKGYLITLKHSKTAETKYPVEATLRVLGVFEGYAEPRLLARDVVVKPKEDREPPKPPNLLDEPTILQVTSRQPVRLFPGGADTHVRCFWNGKDHLVNHPDSKWSFSVSCVSHEGIPQASFTSPVDGRFEALLRTPPEVLIGAKLEFELVAASTDGKKLAVKFSGEAIKKPEIKVDPKKLTAPVPAASQRRPPYKVVIIRKENFGVSDSRWGDEPWNATHVGAYIEPTKTAPVQLCINEGYELLDDYLHGMAEKKADESRTTEKKTKYISHVAYHLYQMYLAAAPPQQQAAGIEPPRKLEESEMQSEINRVGATLIRLMAVSR